MIIVKSIKEKPEECRGCRLLDESTYDCLINSESPAYTTLEGQYEHCPIEEHPDINVGNIDTTTHDSIPAETGKNDGDRTSGDCISRQAMLDGIDKLIKIHFDRTVVLYKARKVAEDLPSAQPEPAIPLSWIEGQIKWLKSMDNAFATLSAEQISALVNKWKDEQDG